MILLCVHGSCCLVVGDLTVVEFDLNPELLLEVVTLLKGWVAGLAKEFSLIILGVNVVLVSLGRSIEKSFLILYFWLSFGDYSTSVI